MCHVPKYGETPWLDYHYKVRLLGYPPHLIVANKLVPIDSKQHSQASLIKSMDISVHPPRRLPRIQICIERWDTSVIVLSTSTRLSTTQLKSWRWHQQWSNLQGEAASSPRSLSTQTGHGEQGGEALELLLKLLLLPLRTVLLTLANPDTDTALHTAPSTLARNRRVIYTQLLAADHGRLSYRLNQVLNSVLNQTSV